MNTIHQSLYTLEVHRVIAACAETTDKTVTLDAHHASLSRELEEVILQLCVFGFEHEADIHARAIFFLGDSWHEEFRVVQAIIEQLGFGFIACLDPFHTTVRFEPT